MAASEMKMSLKLLIDTKSQKVVFGEAGKETVDFLFYILSLPLPLGTVFSLLTSKQGMVGCLENLYKCVDETYIQTDQTKDPLLNLITPTEAAASIRLLFQTNQNKPILKPIYSCTRGESKCLHVAEHYISYCPHCGCSMRIKLKYVAAPPTVAKSEGGFVKGVVTYMVTDDLTVKPMSTSSCISLLKMFNDKDAGALEEKEVDLGMDEALDLLIKSMNSKTVLTDVFLGNMGK